MTIQYIYIRTYIHIIIFYVQRVRFLDFACCTPMSSVEPQGKRPLIRHSHSLNTLKTEHCVVRQKGFFHFGMGPDRRLYGITKFYKWYIYKLCAKHQILNSNCKLNISIFILFSDIRWWSYEPNDCRLWRRRWRKCHGVAIQSKDNWHSGCIIQLHWSSAKSWVSGLITPRWTKWMGNNCKPNLDFCRLKNGYCERNIKSSWLANEVGRDTGCVWKAPHCCFIHAIHEKVVPLRQHRSTWSSWMELLCNPSLSIRSETTYFVWAQRSVTPICFRLLVR